VPVNSLLEAMAGGRFRALVLLLHFWFVGDLPVRAQTDSVPAPAALSVDVNLVVLEVSVRDKKGGFVPGLNSENVQVFEDGAPQTIRLLQHADAPVAVGLIVDKSGSMVRKNADVTRAALAFVRSSNAQDQIFVVNFNENVQFGLPDKQAFSASIPELEAALNRMPASGETALFDAIDAGIEHLKQAALDKKALIVISDGGDNASHRKIGQVLESAERSNAVIYTIGLFDEDDRDSSPRNLKTISRATGGECFLPKEAGEIAPICRQIAEDIRHQYTIAYVPSNQKWDNRYRIIRVTASGLHHEKYLVRTRSGYFASPTQLR